MSTIFDGYSKLNDKQIINQLAILETVNLSNTFKFYKSKVKESTFSTIRKLLGTADRQELKNGNSEKMNQEKINELHKMVKEKIEELKIYSREELDKRLKISLCERAGCESKDSEEIISVEVVNEASKRFSLPDHLTQAKKIETIYEVYNERVLKYLRENPDIIEEIDKLDLTNSKLLIHVFTDKIKSTDIIQGSKNIDREALVESIWLASLGSRDIFTPLIEDLPSFQIKPLENNSYLDDDIYFDAVNKYKQSIKNLETNDYKLADVEKEIDRYEKASVYKKSQLIDLKNRNEQAEKKLREIEVDLDFIDNIYDPVKREEKKDELIKQHADVNQEIVDNNKERIKLNYELEDIERFSNDLKLSKEYILKEKKNLKDFREDARKEYLIEEDNRFFELNALWEPHFEDFELESQFLKEAVEYNIPQRIEIERVLEELYRSKDPRVLANNFKKGQPRSSYNIKFLLSEERVVCLEYSVDIVKEKFKVTLLRILESIE